MFLNKSCTFWCNFHSLKSKNLQVCQRASLIPSSKALGIFQRCMKTPHGSILNASLFVMEETSQDHTGLKATASTNVIKWKRHYLSLQSWLLTENLRCLNLGLLWWLWYRKRDCSPWLILLLQAKVSIAVNSIILDIL